MDKPPVDPRIQRSMTLLILVSLLASRFISETVTPLWSMSSFPLIFRLSYELSYTICFLLFAVPRSAVTYLRSDHPSRISLYVIIRFPFDAFSAPRRTQTQMHNGSI